MKRLIATFVLAGLLGSSPVATAQSTAPSIEPPPWFGGRVEMTERGFSYAVPDGWVAVDPLGDLAEQGRKGWTIEPSDDFATLSMMPAGPNALLWLWPSSHGAGASDAFCQFERSEPQVTPLDEFGEWLATYLEGQGPTMTDVGRPVAVNAPAGQGFRISLSVVVPSRPEAGPMPGVCYVIRGDLQRELWVMCNGWERPDDDWLSIVEAFEWLPDDE